MTDFNMMNEWDLDRDLPRRRSSGEVGRGYGDSGNSRNARMSEVRRRRKRRQRIRRMILLIILCIIILGAIGVGIFFLTKNVSFDKSDSESYTRHIDLSDAIMGNMALWLSTIDGEEIDTKWVKDRCEEITVTAVLTLSKDAGGGKTFSEIIDESSYNAMSETVDNALNNLLAEVIATQLVSGGYAESVSPEEAANIAVSVLGMSMSDYIKENGVNIVPSREEINSLYTIGNGTYSISKGEVTFNASNGEIISEPVINKKDSFVLVNSGKVYTKEGNDNE